jgi:hypothetical protein
MTRKTSIEVYRRIQSEGLLSKLRFEVYDLLFQTGPLTGIVDQLSRRSGRFRAGGTYNGRLSELRRAGVVDEVGIAVDPITGNNVILWDVTDRLPVKFEKPKRYKCEHCKGNGYIEEAQGVLL